jgi:hypothetical protein
LSYLVAAAKKASHDVYVAHQYVNAAKEDVLLTQKLVKEKETQAQIAHQKSESAQQVLRNEAQNVVLAQQKLAKVSAFLETCKINRIFLDRRKLTLLSCS